MAKSPSRQPLYPPNAGVFDRIDAYIEAGKYEQAHQLLNLGNRLEMNAEWDTTKMKRR